MSQDASEIARRPEPSPGWTRRRAASSAALRPGDSTERVVEDPIEEIAECDEGQAYEAGTASGQARADHGSIGVSASILTAPPSTIVIAM